MAGILFVGGAGFLGSNVIRSIQAIRKVYVLEPLKADLSRLDKLDCEIFRGDLSDCELLKSILSEYDIDTIVHLVSTLIPGSVFEDYKREYQNVIFPTIELMQYCAKKDVKFVYFSSGGTIYGNRTDHTPFKETDVMAPVSYYGWSKQMMENSIQYVHRTMGLRYLILRPSNPYGHGQNIYGKQGLIAVALGNILQGKPVTVWGDGTNVRDYIYVDDLANTVGRLLEKDIFNETLNIGSGIGTSVNEIVHVLKEIVDEDVSINFQAARSVDVSHMILDTTSLRKHVPDVIFTPLYKGISQFYLDVKRELKK